MTAYRIHHTARPSLVGGPILDMHPHDRRYSHSRVMPERAREKWSKTK